MYSDVTRWQKKYRETEPAFQLDVDSLLKRHANLLGGHGLALDMAAGPCHTAVHLATMGYRVIALDCSVIALQIGQQLAARMNTHISVVAADLDEWQFPQSAFTVLTCFRYLNRRLFHAMQNIIKPGGLLIYKTFNTHYLREKPRFNPAYLLQPGELANVFPKFEVVECNDGYDPKYSQSWIVGRAPNQ